MECQEWVIFSRFFHDLVWPFSDVIDLWGASDLAGYDPYANQCGLGLM